MNRWCKKSQRYKENVKVDAFLSDLFQLYDKHGMSIGHEDNHGNFIIEPACFKNVEWMMECSLDLDAS